VNRRASKAQRQRIAKLISTEKLSAFKSDPKRVGISFKNDKHFAQASQTGQRVNNAESDQEGKSPKSANHLESAASSQPRRTQPSVLVSTYASSLVSYQFRSEPDSPLL
jgi:hypothetical protein